jgi:N-acetylmuramoyl-L-alanine amidase
MLAFVTKNTPLNAEESLKNARCIFDYLTKNLHWTPNAACGLLGNTYVECKHNPGAWQSYREGNLSGGYGIVQWTPASKYLDWANANGYDPTGMEGQLQRLKYEMDEGFQYYKTKDYPLTFKQFITSVKFPDYLARAFVYNYERPKDPNVDLRAQKAMEYYQILVVDQKEVNEPMPVDNRIKKGDSDFEFIEYFQTKNPTYTKPKPFTPTKILVHDIGCNAPYLKRWVGPDDGFLGVNAYKNYWNNENANKSMHGFIGKQQDGTIAFYNTLPFNYKCWGCGSGTKGSYNSYAIQFEMCRDGMEDENLYRAIIKKAEDACVYFCKTFGIKPEGIVGHYEASALGFASNHGDPSAWMKKFGDSMDKFRARVAARLGNQQTPEEPVKEPEVIMQGKKVTVNTKYDAGLSLWDSPSKKVSKKKAAKGN